MNEAAQASLSAWVPAPILVGLVVGLFGFVLALAVMLLNRGFVSVANFSRSIDGMHNKVNGIDKRVAILEDWRNRK